jgi:hypothetical protein
MSELVETFIEEHKTLMRGLAAILQKVKAGDLVAARELAEDLDRKVGPHIQFEEQVLYPEVGHARGRAFEKELRAEHMTVQRAIKRLIAPDLSEDDLLAQRTELEAALQVAVEHAESCGTLISHLEALSPENQQEATKRHHQFCERKARWTELSEDVA